MDKSPASILDVIDQFLLLRASKDFSTLPGTAIHEFGEHVRNFAATARPSVNSSKQPIYIGGWPSANFPFVDGDMVLSSLLYSEQILVRDPIVDWFSDEQYQVEHLIAAWPGYLDPHRDYSVRMDHTRRFLARIVPLLQTMRPLIDAKIVILVPAEKTYLEHSTEIDRLKLELIEKLAGDPLEYSERFSPSDIAAESNIRGMFALVPGPSRDDSIARAVEHGLRYFSREYSLAVLNGATYTAAFDHELFICREGISRIAGPSSNVAQAILQSDLPIFGGLTPRIIREIHDDDCFAEFRAELHHLYQNAPIDSSTAELDAFVRDQERVLLAPVLAKAEKSASQGLLARIGASLKGSKFSIASGLATDLTLQTGGMATGLNALRTAADSAIGSSSAPGGTQRIWTSLVRHRRSIATEMTRSEQLGDNALRGWSIPTEPSMNVFVSSGVLLHPYGTDLSQKTNVDEGPYRPCECGSGRKFKFCCSGLQKYKPEFMKR